MRRVRFYTPEMGQVGFTRWFEGEEKLPSLDWSKVTSIETSESMTMDQFRSKFPLIEFPQSSSPIRPTNQNTETGGNDALEMYMRRDGR